VRSWITRSGKLFDVTERRVTGEACSVRVLVEEAFRKLETTWQGCLTGEPTGFIELNELTCVGSPVN